MGRKKTKEELISEIQSCFKKHGRVNRRIYNEDEDCSSGRTVYSHFGSFANACDEAGVPHDDKPQKKDKVEVECLQCGRSREVYPYRAKEEFPDGTSKTCKSCMDKKQKVSCSWCGDKIIRHNYQVEQGENFFCNAECLGNWRSENIVGEDHPNYREDKTNFYGNNWSSIREDVIERDNNKCQNCGIERERYITEKNIDLDVHHIKPRKEFTEGSMDNANELDNLETLCRSCHMQKEWSECR